MPIEETWLIDIVGHSIANLSARELAIDVGANRGSWTAELAKAFMDVVAIEPDERNNLLESVADLENVSVVEAAAWHEDGSVTLHRRESPEQNSILEQHPIGGGACMPAPVIDSVQVSSVRLDTVSPEGADFVKIDVEGAEVEVLKGCVEDGTWDRTVFVVECHGTYDAVVEELERLGKEVTKVPHPYVGAHVGHCWAVGSP